MRMHPDGCGLENVSQRVAADWLARHTSPPPTYRAKTTAGLLGFLSSRAQARKPPHP